MCTGGRLPSVHTGDDKHTRGSISAIALDVHSEFPRFRIVKNKASMTLFRYVCRIKRRGKDSYYFEILNSLSEKKDVIVKNKAERDGSYNKITDFMMTFASMMERRHG